jgi:hypothetical protein
LKTVAPQPTPLPLASPPPPLEEKASVEFVIPGREDIIRHPRSNWAVAGPDAAGTISIATGDESTYSILTASEVLPSEPGVDPVDFSGRLLEDRGASLSSFQLLGWARTTLGNLPALEARYTYQANRTPVDVTELHLIAEGRAFVLTGASGPKAPEGQKRLLLGMLYSFAPRQGPVVGPAESPPSRPVYPGAGPEQGLAVKLGLGNFLALQDNSLWEVALQLQITALHWRSGDVLKIESRPTSVFPYLLLNTRTGETVPARYVGRGQGR